MSDIKGAGVMTIGNAVFVGNTIRMILRKVDAEFHHGNGVERANPEIFLCTACLMACKRKEYMFQKMVEIRYGGS